MRKNVFLVLLAVLAMAPVARAQQPRGYYDQYGNYHEDATQNGYYDEYGRWHPNTERNTDDGYYDRDGQWHPDSNQTGGYYDSNGQWHPYANQSGGYYDRDGRWHAYGNDRYGRIAGPDRWTYSEKGRSETLSTAARNFASTVASVAREAYRRSGRDDRIATDSLGRLDERARYFAQVAQQRNRPELIGDAYGQLAASFVDAQRRFGGLAPDAWLANQFHVLAAAIGRLDKRYFGNRAFGGQNPGNLGYGYEQSGYDYDRYGNPLPRRPDARDTRPYPF